MDSAVADCLVTGHEGIVPSLNLPDPDDRHVLAAAISGRASVIVTCDLKYSLPEALAHYGIETQHPDAFILHVLDLDMAVALSAIRNQRARLKYSPRTVNEFLDTLARQELPETVAFLRP